MKKIVFALLAVVLAVSSAYASNDLQWNNGAYANRVAVQQFAPTDVSTLSAVKSTINLGNYIMYAIYSASGTCFMRLMPLSTSTQASYTQVPIPNTTWRVLAKNAATPFLNMSGCVGGFVQKQ